MTSFYLNPLIEGPTSKCSHTAVLESGPRCMDLGGHYSADHRCRQGCELHARTWWRAVKDERANSSSGGGRRVLDARGLRRGRAGWACVGRRPGPGAARGGAQGSWPRAELTAKQEGHRSSLPEVTVLRSPRALNHQTELSFGGRGGLGPGSPSGTQTGCSRQSAGPRVVGSDPG